jgi:hypothetical protein
MVILERTDISTGNVQNGVSAARPKITLDLTADMMLRYDTLIDRVFDFTFDVLGIGEIELRVRERAPGTITRV